jgi:hypothetical protein
VKRLIVPFALLNTTSFTSDKIISNLLHSIILLHLPVIIVPSMPKWSLAMTPQRKHGPPSVIHAGLMRTGTMSMARAYDILDLRAHHGLDMPEMPNDGGMKQWVIIERAAEATWPNVPGGRPAKRFEREDWDELFSEYDVVTDVAAIFADQLIQAYPDAKVVIVQREFDSWWASFQSEVVDGLFFPPAMVLLNFISRITGLRAAKAMQKTLLGAFNARDLNGIKANAKSTYFAYYDRIRNIVPPERRLEYKLGQGWEPLCAFLGKDVPDVPFPRINDRAQHRAWALREFGSIVWSCFLVLRPWIFGTLVCLSVLFYAIISA